MNVSWDALAPAAMVTALVFPALLLVQRRNERRDIRGRLRVEPERHPEDLSALLDHEPAESLAERFDRAFRMFVLRTHLGITPGIALLIIVLSTLGVGSVFIALGSPDWLILIGAALGLAAPLVVFWLLRDRWRLRLQEQLPDGLRLIARALRAGLSLEQAIGEGAARGPGPLSGEFRRVADQVRLGLPAPSALGRMAGRVRLTDFDLFVAAVSLHRSVGGNLVPLVARVADGARDRNQFRGYVKSATAMSRINAGFVASAHPFLILLSAVWYRDLLIRFFQSRAGLTAFAVSVVLEIVGVIWLAILLRVDD